MSRPPMKAIEQIKNYCEKTQCRRCYFGHRTTVYNNSDTDYVGCWLQSKNPCDWSFKESEEETDE